MDSIFGQFRTFYSKLVELGIAVEEITDVKDLTYENLRRYDAIAILDPGAWEFTESGENIVRTSSIPYTDEQLEAYRIYWEKGGHLFISGGDNTSLDIANTNRLLSIFNVSINYDKIPATTIVRNGVANAVQVENINRSHFVGERVETFDYNGASLNVSDDATILAYEVFQWSDDYGVIHTALKPVLIAIEGRLSARVVITCTNFFLDNWGLNNKYGATDDWKLLHGCIFWIMSIFQS